MLLPQLLLPFVALFAMHAESTAAQALPKRILDEASGIDDGTVDPVRRRNALPAPDMSEGIVGQWKASNAHGKSGFEYSNERDNEVGEPSALRPSGALGASNGHSINRPSDLTEEHDAKVLRYPIAGHSEITSDALGPPPTGQPTGQPTVGKEQKVGDLSGFYETSAPIVTEYPTVSQFPTRYFSYFPTGPTSTPSPQTFSALGNNQIGLSAPSGSPSVKPSAMPSAVPSGSPSVKPSAMSSAVPSGSPSVKPSAKPTGLPSAVPKGESVAAQSAEPSFRPSRHTRRPHTRRPSRRPKTRRPSRKPRTWKPLTPPYTFHPSREPRTPRPTR